MRRRSVEESLGRALGANSFQTSGSGLCSSYNSAEVYETEDPAVAVLESGAAVAVLESAEPLPNRKPVPTFHGPEVVTTQTLQEILLLQPAMQAQQLKIFSWNILHHHFVATETDDEFLLQNDFDQFLPRACSTCTFVNRGLSMYCEMCGGTDFVPLEKACSKCTVVNPLHRPSCEACGFTEFQVSDPRVLDYRALQTQNREKRWNDIIKVLLDSDADAVGLQEACFGFYSYIRDGPTQDHEQQNEEFESNRTELFDRYKLFYEELTNFFPIWHPSSNTKFMQQNKSVSSTQLIRLS